MFDLFLQNDGLKHVNDGEYKVVTGLLKLNGHICVMRNIIGKDWIHHMVSVSNVELDCILGGSGDLESDDLALGDSCCPLHLIKQPPPHPLSSM